VERASTIDPVDVSRTKIIFAISPQEARQIEAVSEPVKETVRQMFEHYRPTALSEEGNGQATERAARNTREAILTLIVAALVFIQIAARAVEEPAFGLCLQL
jgi:hypothetical protein